MSEPAPQSLSHKLVRNTIFNSLGRTSGLLGALLITPYVVTVLGPRMFGLWSLVLVLTGYLDIFDFGLRPAFMKYVAEYRLLKKEEDINCLVTSGIVLFLSIGLTALGLTVLFVRPLMLWMRVSPDLFSVAASVIPLAVAVFCVDIQARLLESVLWGLQRMDLSNVVAVIVTILKLAGTVFALHSGYGLVGLVIARGIAALGGVVFLGFGVRKLLPGLRVGLQYVRRASFGILLRYGAKIQVTKLAELAITQGDKLFLGYFVGLPAVAFYELASRIIQGARFLSVIVTSAVVPVASELDVSGDRSTLRQLYWRASKYLVLVAAPLNLFVAAMAPWLVLTWLGQGYDLVVLILQALAIGHFVHVLTASGTTLIRGMGVPEVEMRYALLLSGTSLLFSFALIGSFGFVGVLFATPLALILGSVYFWRSVESLVKTGWQSLCVNVYAFPTTVCLLLGGFTYVAGHRWLAPTASMHRPEALLITLVMSATMVPVYALVIWNSSYLTTDDRQLLARLFRGRLGVYPFAVDSMN